MSQCIRFDKSFFHWHLLEQKSIGRFSISAKCRIISQSNAIDQTYLLLTGVMAGNVYAENHLIKSPPYMYLAVFSENEYKIIRNYHLYSTDQDNHGNVLDRFKSTKVYLHSSKYKRLLSFNDIYHATIGNLSMNAIINMSGWERTDIELQFPINHINVQSDQQKFQVETGPILIPIDERKSADVDSLDIGYIAFNQFKRFEYIALSPHSENLDVNMLFRTYSKTSQKIASIQLLVHDDFSA